MNKYGTLKYKISTRIARKNNAIFMREDFADIGGYDQIGRILKELTRDGTLIRIGYGLYAKAKKSTFIDATIPIASLPALAKEALARLGIKTAPSRLEKEYNAGLTTQVPTGRMIAVKGRISRRIGYDGVYVSYEPAA